MVINVVKVVRYMPINFPGVVLSAQQTLHYGGLLWAVINVKASVIGERYLTVNLTEMAGILLRYLPNICWNAM